MILDIVIEEQLTLLWTLVSSDLVEAYDYSRLQLQVELPAGWHPVDEAAKQWDAQNNIWLLPVSTYEGSIALQAEKPKTKDTIYVSLIDGDRLMAEQSVDIDQETKKLAGKIGKEGGELIDLNGN